MRWTWPLYRISAGFGELQQAAERVAALRGGLAFAQQHALHVVVDVEGAGHRSSPYGSSTWAIVPWKGCIYGQFVSTMIM